MKTKVKTLMVSAASLLVLGVARQGTARIEPPGPRQTPPPQCAATLCNRTIVTASDPADGTESKDLEKVVCAMCPPNMKAISGGASIYFGFVAGVNGAPFRALQESDFDDPTSQTGWCGWARQLSPSGDNPEEDYWRLDVHVMCVPDLWIQPLLGR